MTHLANMLNRVLLDNPKLTARQLAKDSGLTPSYISRLRKGQAGISQEMLAQLARAIGKSARDRAELIAAHMKDEACGYVPDFIQVSVMGKASRKSIDPEIEYLQKHLSDSRIRNAVRSIVELHQNNPKTTP